jgi:thiamine biosynthesis lipoprotein
MRSVSCATAIAVLVGLATLPSAQVLSRVHRQHYCMGTMFDIVVFHASRPDAERAVDRAMAEIVRLDRTMSHFKADSELSRLIRQGEAGFVRVSPDLFAVLEQSLAMSRRSNGMFDVTIGPLLRRWKNARDEERSPSADEISQARRCVGYQKIEVLPPDRVRLLSDCVEIDLGGIGKGYAVDRAMRLLATSGIEHAVVNAGSSSIAARGAPPDSVGWPVTLAGAAPGGRTILLENASISTSQQNGDILDPFTGAPAENDHTVTVVAPTAATADALSTTLLMLSIDEGKKLLGAFADVSAFWIAHDGRLTAAHREVRLQAADRR